MNPKEIVSGKESRERLLAGFKKLYDPVSATLGPGGKNVVIKLKNGYPFSTKDGVTVANSINLSDEVENAGAIACRQAASKSDQSAGDGPQPLYSKVLTPKGWKLMGSIEHGDYVCGTNGSIQKVIGVYPKGEKQVCQVNFTDGRQVECCEDHLWSVTTAWGVKKTLTTREMMDSSVLKYSSNGDKRHQYFVERSWADFNERSVVLDPYLVGLLIGDGSLSGTGTIELSLAPDQGHIINSLPLPKGIYVNSTFVPHKNYYRVKLLGETDDGKSINDLLRSIGLLGTKSDSKFIPDDYLFNSYENRLELLRGLLDSDGHLNSRGKIEYSTISKQLAENVKDLFTGLGKPVHFRLQERKDDSSYSSTPIYRITELKGDKFGSSIDSIVLTDKFVPMQCIKVSNDDHLYFTDGFILTHNTTSATVLAYHMTKAAIDAVDNGLNPHQVKLGMQEACDLICKKLQTLGKPVKHSDFSSLKKIATISANSSEIGEKVAQAFFDAGQDGFVTYELGEVEKVTVSMEQGMTLDRGFESSWLVNNPAKQVAEFKEPVVVVTDKRFISGNDATEFLTKYINLFSRDTPLLLISGGLEGDALATFILNNQQGNIRATAIRMPNSDNPVATAEDIAAFCGATFVPESIIHKMASFDFEAVGKLAAVTVTKDETSLTIHPSNQEKIEAYITNLREREGEDNKERIAKLKCKVATIKVGAGTQIEAFEVRDRVEDSVMAVKAAIEKGVIPGGGVGYLVAQSHITFPEGTPSFNAGVDIVRFGSRMALRKILENSQVEWTQELENKLILENAATFSYTFDGLTGEVVSGRVAGILDPVKVAQSSLEAAVSIAGLYSTTDAVIVEINDK